MESVRCKSCSYRPICMGRCGRMHLEFSEEHISNYCQMNQAMFNLFLENKTLLEEILNQYPALKLELKHWILEYTEFTP